MYGFGKILNHLHNEYMEISLEQRSPTFLERVPLKWNIPWQGLHCKIQLVLGVTASVSFRLLYSNFFINHSQWSPNSYCRLHVFRM